MDSLVLYDPYSLTTADIIINYDNNASIKATSSSIGDFGNKTDLSLTLHDSLQNRFTNNKLTSDVFDMSSYPIRTNIALHPNRFYGDTDYYKAGGSGILVSPNAVLTAGHLIGYEANHIDLGIHFRWKDSLYVTPSLQDGYPQPEIGKVRVKKCYVFKCFVNALGKKPTDDLALLILDKPIGYDIGWVGLGYVSVDSFLLKNTFHNFSYPGRDGYDGLNMYYKYGQFYNVNNELTSASNRITAVVGESGSGFFHTDNVDYTAYGIRTYTNSYTLLTEHKFRILNELIEDNAVSSLSSISEPSKRIVIYPNPATDFVYIKFEDKNYNPFGLSVHNIQGQVIIDKKDFHNGGAINISNLPTGLYMIYIRTEKELIIKRLLVK